MITEADIPSALVEVEVSGNIAHVTISDAPAVDVETDDLYEFVREAVEYHRPAAIYQHLTDVWLDDNVIHAHYEIR